jgi:cardiolipin synthase
MRQQGCRRSRRSRWALVRRCVSRCLLGMLTGCQGPATLYHAQPGDVCLSRRLVIAQQLVSDSAVAVARHPLRSGQQLCCEAADHLRAWAEGGFGKRLVVPLLGEPPPLVDNSQSLDLAALEEELYRLTGRDLQPAEVKLFIEGGDALAFLEHKIGKAVHRIDVIMFYWDNDEVGRQLAARLAARAGPDLLVRILIDGGGNQFFGEPNSAGASDVNAAVAALAYNPYVQVIRIRNPFARYDHRKVVLIDGCWAWTGGRNFSRQAFRASHDLSFSIAGPLVEELQDIFDQRWEQQGGEPGSSRHRVASSRQQAAGNNCNEQQQPLTQTINQPNAQGRLLHSTPTRREFARAIYEAVDRAKHHIYVENVYLSDSLLIYKLIQARQRGVDVRVALTFTSGTCTIDGSNRVVANRLVRAGVRVFVNPGMTHVKALCVDGCWAYLGTGNFDPLSFRHNHEVGLALCDCPLVQELEERLFQPDFCPLWELAQPVPLHPGDCLSELVAGLWL